MIKPQDSMLYLFILLHTVSSFPTKVTPNEIQSIATDSSFSSFTTQDAITLFDLSYFDHAPSAPVDTELLVNSVSSHQRQSNTSVKNLGVTGSETRLPDSSSPGYLSLESAHSTLNVYSNVSRKRKFNQSAHYQEKFNNAVMSFDLSYFNHAPSTSVDTESHVNPGDSQQESSGNLKKYLTWEQFEHKMTEKFYLYPELLFAKDLHEAFDWNNIFLALTDSRHIVVPTKFYNPYVFHSSRIMNFRTDATGALEGKTEFDDEWNYFFGSGYNNQRKNSAIPLGSALKETIILGPYHEANRQLYKVKFTWEGEIRKYLMRCNTNRFYFCPYNATYYFLVHRTVKVSTCIRMKLRISFEPPEILTQHLKKLTLGHTAY